MKQAKEKEVALLYLDNNNLKSLNKGLERDIKKLEKLLSLTSDTCEQQVDELMEKQKEIDDYRGFISFVTNPENIVKYGKTIQERINIATYIRDCIKAKLKKVKR